MNIRKTTLSSLFFPFLIVTSYTKDGEMGPSSNAAYYYKAYKGYIDIHKASGNFEHNCIDGYRYVLVPGGIRIGANINVNDFNQVKAAFNIAD
jgi:hypothetical protein